MNCDEVMMEFMRKERFERIKDRFEEIDSEAQKVINSANSNDILALSMTFSNPKIIKAQIFSEQNFIDLAF